MHIGASLAIAIFIVLSCQRLPEPAFSYAPTENPEAGEAVQFTNESKNAATYNWDFGDGGSSTENSPEYLYQEAGIFGVRLTASNDSGEESIVQSVTIYEPTILGFFVFRDTDQVVLPAAQVWIYDNETDWENVNEPLREGITDDEGRVFFRNLEPVVYHMWAIKEGTGGIWIFGGFTSKLEQNKSNNFNVPCVWVPNEQKATFNFESCLDLDKVKSLKRMLLKRR